MLNLTEKISCIAMKLNLVEVDADDVDVLCTCAALGRSCAPAQVALVSHTQSPLSFGFEFSRQLKI